MGPFLPQFLMRAELPYRELLKLIFPGDDIFVEVYIEEGYYGADIRFSSDVDKTGPSIGLYESQIDALIEALVFAKHEIKNHR